MKTTIIPPIKRGWRRSAPLLQRCELALARWGLAGRGMEPFFGAREHLGNRATVG